MDDTIAAMERLSSGCAGADSFASSAGEGGANHDARNLESEMPHEPHEAPMNAEPADAGVCECADAETAPAGAPHGDARPPAPKQIIEALLFASDAPLSLNRIVELLDGALSATETRLAISELNDEYVAAGRAFRVECIARGYQLLTLPAFHPWIARLNHAASHTRLTDATLETLAIVAYKQPVIRTDVESIRGVACGDALNRLRELGLVKIVGRAEIVGRPMLYGTTRKFLDAFGLSDLDELPPMETLTLRPRTALALPAQRADEPPVRSAVAGA